MTDTSSGAAEFDLIARIRARVSAAAHARPDVVLGIGDDAALLRVPSDRLLVVATDTLNDGVHFPADTAPGDLGWKSLAVNLSDLAAMGARPAWCTLSLSLHDADTAWLDAFLDGFLELATLHGVALVGGDTTRGPLSICVTAHGLVAQDAVLRRDGARVGDDLWVTGTLGDAAAAMRSSAGGRCRRACAARAPRSADATRRFRKRSGTSRTRLHRCFRRVARRCRTPVRRKRRRGRYRSRIATRIRHVAGDVHRRNPVRVAGDRWR